MQPENRRDPADSRRSWKATPLARWVFLGSIGMWLYKLRGLNGPNFTWPLLMFSGAISEKNLQRMGKIYRGKPLQVKTREELIASLRPKDMQYLRADNGDMPMGHAQPVAAHAMAAV